MVRVGQAKLNCLEQVIGDLFVVIGVSHVATDDGQVSTGLFSREENLGCVLGGLRLEQ